MTNKATIYYYDIGDYLSREEKLDIIQKMGSLDNPAMNWNVLHPNEHNDWINHRNDRFGEFIPLAPEKKFNWKAQAIFTTYAIGVVTNRDAWVYNFSKQILSNNMESMIAFYNEQSDSFKKAKQASPQLKVENFIDTDETKISWTRFLRNSIAKNATYQFYLSGIRSSNYRPFCKQNLYFDKVFNEAIGLSPLFFPTESANNTVICISSSPNDGVSVLISDKIANLHFNGDTQCFPLYWYEEIKQENTLFDTIEEQGGGKYARRDAISDFALNQARKLYGGKTTREDIFYYVYGFLHNPDYRTEFAADLKKMLPRIPFVGDSTVFWKYVKAGRALAQLHLHYEDYANEAAGVTININNAVYDNFEVTKMRFASKGDKSTIIYNSFITLTGIPAEAYDYVVNGKSAIEWIMERYAVTTHKESGIVNDPNDWAREHNQPRYILDLLLSVITLSVRTVEIVKQLPKVEM